MAEEHSGGGSGGGGDALSLFTCMNHPQGEDESEAGCVVTEAVGWVHTQPGTARAEFSLSLWIREGKSTLGVTFKWKNIFSKACR